MKLVPLHDHVIVKAGKAETKTESGIILPDTVEKGRPEQGEVVAIGPGKLLDNGSRATMTVSVGQKVVFKKYGPDEVKVDNVEYLVIAESDILAIIE